MTPVIERIDIQTPSPTDELIGRLRAAVPEYFTEGQLDTERLLAMLGHIPDGKPDRYSFSWAGKREAIRALQTPSGGTLVPVPEESVNWDTTQHLFIEGDNLEVLKLLYKPYFGKVKLIYIDPPYNTGNDFVYPDDFADPLGRYLEITGQKDAAGNLVTSNPETSGRYHSAWLSMMYPRLFLARQLLRDDGVIFVSIDDNEVHNLRHLMNELFGEENFIASIVWQKKYSPQNDATYFSAMHDYLLVFAKRAKATKNDAEGWERNLLARTDEQISRYKNLDNDPRGPWKSSGLDVKTYAAEYDYPITTPSGRIVKPPKGKCWRYPRRRFLELVADNRIWFGPDGANVPSIKRFLSEVQQGVVPTTWWERGEVGDNQEATREVRDLLHDVDVFFDNPKPVRLIEHIIHLATQPNSHDVILDFFAGSCTTGHAVMKANRDDHGNRRFILVQFPEPIRSKDMRSLADLGRMRLQRAIEKISSEEIKNTNGKAQLKGHELGFRTFRLVTTSFQQWKGTASQSAEDYVTQLTLISDSLIPGTPDSQIIYELAIKEGFGLILDVEPISIGAEKPIYFVRDKESGRSFYSYFGKNLQLGHVAGISLQSNEVFICRDEAIDDTTAANLMLQCRLKLF